MIFNFIHPAVLVFLNGIFIIWSGRAGLEEKNLRKRSLENIILGAGINLVWIVIGFFRNVDVNILVFEGLGICLVLLAFIMKLNLSGEHKILGRQVPGHGAPESKQVIIIKNIIFFILVFLIVAVAIFMALNLI
jgi:hypothetical protein